MILRAAALCLLAWPAEATDFRGLLPGMEASELAHLGEPFERDSQGPLTFALYPLPFERVLEVLHTDAVILSVGLNVMAGSEMQPPDEDGLRVGQTTLADARRIAGSDGFAFDTYPSLPELPISGWRLSYTLAEHPDLVLSLLFFDRITPALGEAAINSADDLPQDAILIGAELMNPALMGGYPDMAPLVIALPTFDAAPLAIPLVDAFPLLDIPR